MSEQQDIRTEAFAGHTPEPWRREDDDNGMLVSISRDGQDVLHPFLDIDTDGSVKVYMKGGYDCERSSESQDANIALAVAAPALLADRDRLAAWKADAMAVEATWDEQAVGNAMGLPVGADIRPAILPYIQKANAARDWLQDALDRMTRAADLLAAALCRHAKLEPTSPGGSAAPRRFLDPEAHAAMMAYDAACHGQPAPLPPMQETLDAIYAACKDSTP